MGGATCGQLERICGVGRKRTCGAVLCSVKTVRPAICCVPHPDSVFLEFVARDGDKNDPSGEDGAAAEDGAAPRPVGTGGAGDGPLYARAGGLRPAAKSVMSTPRPGAALYARWRHMTYLARAVARRCRLAASTRAFRGYGRRGC